MLHRHAIRFLAAMGLVLFAASAAPAQSPEEFQRRREAARANMEPGSVMILRGNPDLGGVTQGGVYRQDSNFYYLTGMLEPGGTLVMRAGRARGRRGRRGGGGGGSSDAILFITPPNTGQSDWDALTTGLAAAGAMAGIEDVRPAGEFQAEYERALTSGLPALYIEYERSTGLHTPPTPDEALFKKARDKGATFQVERSSSIVNPLRRVKSPAEIEYLMKATAITNAAHREVMRSAAAGMYEFQIQSILEYVFHFNGAERIGFQSIVGSGPNSCILHWEANTRRTQAGDVVVVDIGAEYNMYTADVTRTIPISGKFSPRQREIYEIVLAANEAAIDLVAPGVTMTEINAVANAKLVEGLQRVGLIESASELRQYYYHGLSHSLGLAVHDVGGLGTLEAGMVLTIEPGIYIREEGIGFRIEDDILVTEEGHLVMTAGAPKRVADIEAMMAETGMDFRRFTIDR